LIQNKDHLFHFCDGLFAWWENVCEAYEAGKPLTEDEKQQELHVYLAILEALIQAKANLHLWDAEEFYGPLWDAASSACVPVVQRLLMKKSIQTHVMKKV
jgi:hypothetical protein